MIINWAEIVMFVRIRRRQAHALPEAIMALAVVEATFVAEDIVSFILLSTVVAVQLIVIVIICSYSSRNKIITYQY